MITTTQGFKKLESSDYVSSAFYGDNSAFNANVTKTEEKLDAKLEKNNGTLYGKTKLSGTASLAWKNGNNEINAMSFDTSGNMHIGGDTNTAITGDVKLYGNNAYVVNGQNSYKIWNSKNMTVSVTAPQNPSEGDIWIDIS